MKQQGPPQGQMGKQAPQGQAAPQQAPQPAK